MSKPGQKPVPVAIRKLRGTVSETNSTEAKFHVPDELPKPPTHLNRWGKKCWQQYGNILLAAGLFTEADQIALEMLSTAYGRWIEAEHEVKKTGTVLVSSNGGVYQNPALSVANRSYDNLIKLLATFGMSPAERTRVVTALSSDSDDLASLLFSGIDE